MWEGTGKIPEDFQREKKRPAGDKKSITKKTQANADFNIADPDQEGQKEQYSQNV